MNSVKYRVEYGVFTDETRVSAGYYSVKSWQQRNPQRTESAVDIPSGQLVILFPFQKGATYALIYLTALVAWSLTVAGWTDAGLLKRVPIAKREA